MSSLKIEKYIHIFTILSWFIILSCINLSFSFLRNTCDSDISFSRILRERFPRNVPIATKVPKVTGTSLRSRGAPPPYPFNCITSPTSRGVHTIHGRLLGLLRRLVTDYSCKSHNGCGCIWRACDHRWKYATLTSHPLIKSTIDGSVMR